MPRKATIIHMNYETGEMTGGTAAEREECRAFLERNYPYRYCTTVMRCEIDWGLMRKRAAAQGGAR